MKNRRIAIIGGSECGKSFLALGFSRGYWRKHRIRSFIFDPWLGEKGAEPWGPQAWVTKDFEQWKHVVTHTEGGCAVWDETTGYGGRDAENNPLFSEIRHRHPVLICNGHSRTSILPAMRVNLTDLILFSADEEDAKKWGQTMKDADVGVRAVGLPQYTFLHKQNFQPVRIATHSAEAIRAGVLP